MSLSVGQLQYNGVTIGPGGVAQLTTVQGLTGLPTARTGDVAQPNRHGMLGGYDFMGTRSITINCEVTATSGNFMPVNLETLRAAMQMSQVAAGGISAFGGPQCLQFNFGQGGSGTVGVNRWVAARIRKFDDTVDISFAGGNFQTGLAKVQILAETIDPFIYDTNIQTASVGLTTQTGGLTFPAGAPFLFGSQTGGVLQATNLGSVVGPCLMTVTGPCTNPRIEQETTGVTLQFNMTLGASDTLVLDTFYGSAILDGTVSRTNDLASGSYINAFGIQPGVNNIGFFSSDATATGATLTVEWANTWA